MRVAFVTTSMGGAGHLARILAVARGLVRNGAEVTFCAFGPPHAYPDSPEFHYQAIDLDIPALQRPGTAEHTALAQALVQWRPDLILVDMFWQPLRHLHRLLPGIPWWLLLRDVPRTWLHGPLMAPFSAAPWQRIIGIEPHVQVAVREEIPPLVSFNPDECFPATALREQLQVPAGQPLLLVAQTGEPHELAELRALAGQRWPAHAVVGMSLHPGTPHLYPLAPWLMGADRLFGGAGYNFFWETRWLGLHERTAFHPFKRSIDDQQRRVDLHTPYIMRQNGADVLAEMIARG